MAFRDLANAPKSIQDAVKRTEQRRTQSLKSATKQKSKEKKGRARMQSTRTRVGALVFDSALEAEAYQKARATYPAVFVQAEVELGHGESACILRFDRIDVLKVNPDGTFLARAVDAKPFRREKMADGTTRMKPFVMEDAAIKKKWFQSQSGIRLFLEDGKGNEA